MRTRDVVLSNLMCISSCFFCISPFYYFNAMSSICVILPNHGWARLCCSRIDSAGILGWQLLCSTIWSSIYAWNMAAGW
jgi:hypothetical protein